jgi:endonuclease-3
LDEIISTILSQNTNDQNQDAAYQNLRLTFPTWEQVRDAPAEKVIAAIRSAGLANQKAPRIQTILHQISSERGNLNLDFLSHMPCSEVRAWLMRFKGIGPKTAAIVMQFSLGCPAFPVDTHIYRVTGRLGLRPARMNAERAHTYFEQLFTPRQYEACHLNLIRLGREICLARTPHCPGCPINPWCDYFQQIVAH